MFSTDLFSTSSLRAFVIAGAIVTIPALAEAAPQVLFGGQNALAGQVGPFSLASLRPDQDVTVAGGVLQIRYDDGTTVSFSPGARFHYSAGAIELISGSVNIIVPSGAGAPPRVTWQGQPVLLFAGASVGLVATDNSLNGRVSRGSAGFGGTTYQSGQSFRGSVGGSTLAFAPMSQTVPEYQPAISGSPRWQPPGVDPTQFSGSTNQFGFTPTVVAANNTSQTPAPNSNTNTTPPANNSAAGNPPANNNAPAGGNPPAAPTPVTATKMEWSVAYAGSSAGYDLRNPANVVITTDGTPADANGVIAARIDEFSYSSCCFSETFSRGTQQTPSGPTLAAPGGPTPPNSVPERGKIVDSAGNDIIAWTRWTDGVGTTETQFTGAARGLRALAAAEGEPRTTERTANQGFHVVAGAPPATLPELGTATYTLIGATRPTIGNGSAAPGTFSGSLGVDFGKQKVGVNFNVGLGGGTYNLKTTGGSDNPAVGGMSLFADANGVKSLFRNNGEMNELTVSTSGTNIACPAGCRGAVVGFLAGSGASHAGAAYSIGPVEGAGTAITGAAAFARGAITVPTPVSQ